MAYLFIIRLEFLVVVILCVATLCCNLGKADEEVPQTGTGFVGGDPDQIVAKALLCFNDKSVYSRCEEAYRLTESGNLNIPSEYVDPYCNGPCLTERHLLLNCIENVKTNFIFYNRATIQDLKDTIKAGCSNGPERGNFNVAEHIQAEGSSGYKATNKILLGLGFMIGGNLLLL